MNAHWQSMTVTTAPAPRPHCSDVGAQVGIALGQSADVWHMTAPPAVHWPLQ